MCMFIRVLVVYFLYIYIDTYLCIYLGRYWKQWRDRYVVIRNYKVYTYKSQTCMGIPTEVIDLRFCYIRSTNNDNNISQNIYSLTIYHKNGCEFNFRTYSKHEHAKWLTIISNNISISKDIAYSSHFSDSLSIITINSTNSIDSIKNKKSKYSEWIKYIQINKTKILHAINMNINNENFKIPYLHNNVYNDKSLVNIRSGNLIDSDMYYNSFNDDVIVKYTCINDRHQVILNPVNVFNEYYRYVYLFHIYYIIFMYIYNHI